MRVRGSSPEFIGVAVTVAVKHALHQRQRRTKGASHFASSIFGDRPHPSLRPLLSGPGSVAKVIWTSDRDVIKASPNDHSLGGAVAAAYHIYLSSARGPALGARSMGCEADDFCPPTAPALGKLRPRCGGCGRLSISRRFRIGYRIVRGAPGVQGAQK